MPADIVYGSLDETPNESDDGYFETVRDRTKQALLRYPGQTERIQSRQLGVLLQPEEVQTPTG